MSSQTEIESEPQQDTELRRRNGCDSCNPVAEDCTGTIPVNDGTGEKRCR
jgi:hypothetical protein